MSASRHVQPTLLIADDHQVFAEGLAATLGRRYKVIGQAFTLEQVRAAVVAHRPDVVILDISFRGVSSLPLLAELTADPTVASRFLVVTGLESTALATVVFEMGAAGFLLKGAGTTELVEAITVVLAGDHDHGAGTLEPAPTGRVPPDAPTIPIGGFLLRPRQVEILALMVDGLNRAQIGQRLGISPKGVDYHLAEFRERVGLPSAKLVLKWAVGQEGELKAAAATVWVARTAREDP